MATLEPNEDGVLTLECECGRKVVKHVDQVPSIPGGHHMVFCVCKRFRFALKREDGQFHWAVTGISPEEYERNAWYD